MKPAEYVTITKEKHTMLLAVVLMNEMCLKVGWLVWWRVLPWIRYRRVFAVGLGRRAYLYHVGHNLGILMDG
jgi:hypothetical protein